MNKKFISHSNYVLRKILNSKDNLDILKDLIESFLEIRIKKIELNPYLKVKSSNLPKEENYGIADVKICLENGKEKNIGIQFVDGYHIMNKILLYYLQVHYYQEASSIEEKEANTITVNFLDLIYLKGDKCHTKLEIPSQDKKIDKLEVHIIELPKFYIKDLNRISKKDAWIMYFAGMPIYFMKPLLKSYEKIQKLDKLLDEYWRNEKME